MSKAETIRKLLSLYKDEKQSYIAPNRSVKVIPEHIRLDILAKRARLIKQLVALGEKEDRVIGMTIVEMEELVEDLEG